MQSGRTNQRGLIGILVLFPFMPPNPIELQNKPRLPRFIDDNSIDTLRAAIYIWNNAAVWIDMQDGSEFGFQS